MSSIGSRVFSQRWLGVVAVLALGPAVANCDSAIEPGQSTETGNPPVLRESLVRLEMRTRGAVIIGAPGSAPPGVDTVTAVELRTGEVATGTVSPDGSFEIRVSADQGIYYVMAGEVAGLGEARARAARDPNSVVTVGNISIQRTAEQLGLGCFAEQWQARGLIEAAVEAAPVDCEADSDCVVASWEDPCSNQCGLLAARGDAADALAGMLDELPQSVCPDTASGECGVAEASFTCDPAPYEAQCVQNRCTLWNAAEAAACGGPPVWLDWSRYRENGSLVGHFSYSGQAYFALSRRDDDGTTCVTTLMPCSEGNEYTADADLRAAVAAQDVQDLLDHGGVALSAGDAEARLEIDIYVWGGAVRLSFPTCAGCGASSALLELSEVLRQVEQAHDPCADCLSPMSNLDVAGELPLGGCSCGDAGSEVCADGVPLRCGGESDRWTHAPSSSACD